MSKHVELVLNALSVWRVPLDVMEAKRQMRASQAEVGDQGVGGNGVREARAALERARLRLHEARVLVLFTMGLGVVASFAALIALNPVPAQTGALQPLTFTPLVILAVGLTAMAMAGLGAWYCHHQVHKIDRQHPCVKEGDSEVQPSSETFKPRDQGRRSRTVSDVQRDYWAAEDAYDSDDDEEDDADDALGSKGESGRSLANPSGG